MELFLVDNGVSYSHDKLLADIDKRTTYYPMLKTNSLYDYFLNFIVALISNQPLILIDSDISFNEVDGLDESRINKEKDILELSISSFEELYSLIKKSTSKITLFTSGTTGQPKKVIHNVETLTRTTKISDKHNNQIWAYAYNPTHMAGLQVFFQAFLNQNTLINTFNLQRQDIYLLIDQFQITHISATPTFYRLLLPVENQYLSVMRVTFGGEKSDSKLYESIQKIFPNGKINNIYASTEAGSLFIAKGEYFQIPDNIKDKIKIEDGELLLHKSLLGVSEGFNYDNDYYKTGDLIEWVEDGLFRFKSRKNELINVGGYKINPEEVENIITKLTGIRQVLVYGKVNSVLGNILCADIIKEESSYLTEADIRKELTSQMQDFKIPRRIRFVNEFELTRTGKIKRI